MGNKIDLTGQVFNRLTVLYETSERKYDSIVWHCQCSCGNECDVASIDLRKGRVKSCGCLKKETDRAPKGNVINLIGQKFGHLTVIERDGSDARGEAKWKCQCDCQLAKVISVLGSNLRNGHTTSCGCDRSSHGEKIITNLLLDYHIPFTTQYRISELKQYSFDFYIAEPIPYLIEYDGETHYKANLHGWHNEQQLSEQQKRDQVKNEFCLSHNLPLIRIPYWHLPKLCIEDLKLETSQFIIK